ncbi:MAG: phosphate ABC transporter substrate-binding protein PstS [Deltaproteobacteria bacterium CG11_big_fil_rev_8_21_14_0_20_47_16]|nr:MAG: phosphate ABC transporter substrate-binding protein PstS [Deltaproteobacteria bacterium CG11_big_fil_rev_8_21_14_0_20_47_16]
MKRFNAIVLMLILSSVASVHAAILINGAGATFPYPIYSKWFDLYHRAHPTYQFNYQSIGSGGGIRQFLAETVDFGATDAPMKNKQIESAPGRVVHIPTVMGAVAVVYNLPELTQPLQLSGELLADIFMGKVKKWSDARIAALNTGVVLPDRYILVMHRSDGSGTTAVFTDYLAKVNEAWAKDVGHGKAVNWPAGLGAKGNEGVTGLVHQMPGAIGYVEMAYAEQNKLAVVSLRNKQGEFVLPSSQAVSRAAAGAVIPDDFRVSITDADGSGAYPISSFTYLLVYDPAKDQVKGQALIGFLKWAMRMGQTFAEPLHYAPLPKSLIERVQSRISQMK